MSQFTIERREVVVGRLEKLSIRVRDEYAGEDVEMYVLVDGSQSPAILSLHAEDNTLWGIERHAEPNDAVIETAIGRMIENIPNF